MLPPLGPEPERLSPTPVEILSADDRLTRLARAAGLLGLELPPFDSPLVAFDPAPERSSGDPVYLGGDLHAVHPDVGHRSDAGRRDPSLDYARVTLGEVGPSWPKAVAIEGVWCVRLEGDCARFSPFFMLWDDLGRLRAWLLLPPAEAMLGEGQLWLPAVPPASEVIGPDSTGATGTSSPS